MLLGVLASGVPAAFAAAIPSVAIPSAVGSHIPRWAAREDYLELNGWNFGTPLERPLQTGPDPARTPESDLREIIRQAYAQPLPTGPAVGESVWCQEFTNLIFLRDRLSEIGLRLPDPPHCTAFESWADEATLEGIEVLFVSPTGRRLAATFGHTMIRLVRNRAGHSPNDDTVYEIVALVGFRNTAIDYVSHGLMGDFPLVFQPTRLRAVMSENLWYEQRDIQRFRLRLNAPQRRRVLERLWELERRAYLPYRFLDRNCATYLAWALTTANRDTIGLRSHGWFVETPADVVDVFATGTSGVSEESLIERIERPLEATIHHAMRSKRTRDDTIEQIAEAVPALAERWRSSPEVLGPGQMVLVRETLSAAPTTVGPIVALSSASVMIARGDYDIARAEAEQVDRLRMLTIPGEPLPDYTELAMRRRRLYVAEDQERREELRTADQAWVESYLARAPRRPATEAELELVEDARQHQLSFAVAAEVHAEILDLTHRDPEPVETSSTPDSTIVASGSAPRRIAIERSASEVASLVYQSAFWREELGQVRPHGLRPWRALTLLESETRLSRVESRPKWGGTFLRPISLVVADSQPVPSLRWALDRFGLSAELEGQADLSGGWLGAFAGGIVLLKDGSRSPLLVGLSATAGPGTRVTGAGASPYLAVRTEAFTRYALGSTGGLRTSVQWADGLRMPGALDFECRLDWPFDRREAFALVSRGQVECGLDGSCGWRMLAGLGF